MQATRTVGPRNVTQYQTSCEIPLEAYVIGILRDPENNDGNCAFVAITYGDHKQCISVQLISDLSYDRTALIAEQKPS